MWVVGRITGQNNPLSVCGHKWEGFGVGDLCFRVKDDFVLVGDGEDPLVEGPMHRLGKR